MKRRVVIECGAAQTRAALLEGEEALKFWVSPARGDEAVPRAVEDGDLCLGRVTSVSKPLRGAFVDIGGETDAFLPFGQKEAPLPEGAIEIFSVRRPPISAKGAVLFMNWRKDASAAMRCEAEADAQSSKQPRRLGAAADAAVAIVRKAAIFASDVVIDGSDAAAALAKAGFNPVVDDAAVFDADIGTAIDEALLQDIILPCGARMKIEETEALVAVDIDMGSAAATNAAMMHDAVNRAAAARLFRELSRRSIGGRIVVDFLPPAAALEKRKAFAELLRCADLDLFPRRGGKLAPDGLYDLTAPRREVSLLHRATEIAGADWPQPGRSLKLDWRAKAAVDRLERRLRQAPSRFIQLVASPDLAAYLRERPRWTARLRASFGARFSIEADCSLGDRNFDVVEARAR